MGISDLTLCLRALADPARLRLLALCADAPVPVSDLASALGASEPTVSRHLKALAAVGLVRRARRGQFVEYSLVTDGPYGVLVVEALRFVPQDDPALHRAQRRLLRRVAKSSAQPSEVASTLSPRLAGKESARVDAALAATILAGAGAGSRPRAADSWGLVIGVCPVQTLAALGARHGRLLVTVSGVAQRTAQRRRLADAGLDAQVVLRGDAAALLQGERVTTAFIDATGESGPASMDADLRWARSLLAGPGRCWLLADYDALEASQSGGGRPPPLELRARLEQQGYVAERIHPVEADGLHRLLVEASLRSVARVQAA